MSSSSARAFADAKVNTSDVVDQGDPVWVKVLETDHEAGKVSLSMKYVSQVSLKCAEY